MCVYQPAYVAAKATAAARRIGPVLEDNWPSQAAAGYLQWQASRRLASCTVCVDWPPARDRPLGDSPNGSHGSAASVRGDQMQPLGPELVAFVGRLVRTTAVVITDSVGEVGEGQVPRQTGRSLGKPPPATLGRNRPTILTNRGPQTGH